MTRPSLQFSEWFIICFFLGLLAVFVVVSKISSWKVQKTLSQIVPVRTVSVEVSGEVFCPGVYKLKETARLKELLEKAKPKRFADLSALDFSGPLPASLHISRLSAIHVTVSGEGVEQISILELEPGIRLSQIKSKIPLAKDADLSLFRSQRMLKDGEEILVKKKKINCT